MWNVWSCNPRSGWVRAMLCISNLCIFSVALYIFAMHSSCYIRDVVPCGPGHRLIVSRGRVYKWRGIYEFNGDVMIYGYTYTARSDILHTQVRGDTPASPIFLSLISPLKSCTLRWGGDTPAAPISHSLNLAHSRVGETPQLHPFHTR